MAITVKCPICAGFFEVAEKPLAPTVHCPTCGTDFTPGTDQVTDPATRAAEPTQNPDRARAVLRIRAQALLAVGILGASINLLWLIRSLLPDLLPGNYPWLANPFGTSIEVILGMSFLVLNVIIILGAWQMLRFKTYWLAMTACCLATINFGNLCCLLSYPIGVWSYAALRQPEVRSLFK